MFKIKFGLMSLKIIHTADWHLGQTFFGYDRGEEHAHFLAWLLGLLEDRAIDVLLIAGDLFDVANPSANAQRALYDFLKEAHRINPSLQIIIIAGNHDSAVRLEAPVPLLEEFNTSVVGVIKRLDSGEIDLDSLIVPLNNAAGEREALCMAVPFLRQGDYPQPSEGGRDSYTAGVARMYEALYAHANSMLREGEAIVAMGHLHVSGAEISPDDVSERAIMGGLEYLPASIFNDGIAYTALGHIHRPQRIAGLESLRYSGSPLPMSFSEKRYRHQLVEVLIEDGALSSVEPIEIPRMADLMVLPESPLPPDELIRLIEELPDRADGQPQSAWPYLELHVLLEEPDPTFRHRVEEAIKDKAVRMTSIIPSYPGGGDDDAPQVAMSYDDLRKIDPLDMLRHAFTSKYGGDLPDEMAEMFNEVLREVSQ